MHAHGLRRCLTGSLKRDLASFIPPPRHTHLPPTTQELGICTVYFSYCATNLAAAFLDTTPTNANSTALHRDDDAESSRRLKL